MICEFCNVQFASIVEARRHILTASHMREKQGHDLSIEKTIDRRLQATLQPKNIQELLELLNIRSTRDVYALDVDFFRIDRVMDYKLTKELMLALLNSAINFHMSRLPMDLRRPLEESIFRHLSSESFGGGIIRMLRMFSN